MTGAPWNPQPPSPGDPPAPPPRYLSGLLVALVSSAAALAMWFLSEDALAVRGLEGRHFLVQLTLFAVAGAGWALAQPGEGRLLRAGLGLVAGAGVGIAGTFVLGTTEQHREAAANAVFSAASLGRAALWAAIGAAAWAITVAAGTRLDRIAQSATGAALGGAATGAAMGLLAGTNVFGTNVFATDIWWSFPFDGGDDGARAVPLLITVTVMPLVLAASATNAPSLRPTVTAGVATCVLLPVHAGLVAYSTDFDEARRNCEASQLTTPRDLDDDGGSGPADASTSKDSGDDGSSSSSADVGPAEAGAPTVAPPTLANQPPPPRTQPAPNSAPTPSTTSLPTPAQTTDPSNVNRSYRVALFGDVPYSTSGEVAYDRLIDDVDADAVAFSIHVGDFQASTPACTDDQVIENIGRFDRFETPLVYTPGDNEWTDCGNSPTTRLGRLRELVFAGTGTQSQGAATMPLKSQDSLGYPENTRWTSGPVTYATLHVVGSDDGVSNPAEHMARREATITWMRQAFDGARARGDKGIVLLAHADLRFGSAEGAKGAYESMFQALRQETTSFAGQVLYVHGDGHTFLNDRPMKRRSGSTVKNFRRVEVYGSPTVRWVRLTVDPDGSTLFTITSPPPP